MTKDESYKIKIESRISRIEVLLDEIKNNHLASIEKRIDRMQWLVVTTCIAVILNLLTRLL